MENELLETWEINARIDLYLLAAVPPEALTATAASRGRTVGEQFAHIHNVRLMWLKSADPELLDGLAKVEGDRAHDREAIRVALEQSASAVTEVLRRSLAGDGRIRGFKPHAAAFLGYLISHESHHRGQIALSLKQSGHPLERKVAYGLWEWGVR